MYALFLRKKTKLVTHLYDDGKLHSIKNIWRNGEANIITNIEQDKIFDYYKIFFDEKTSLEEKRNFALEELGYDSMKNPKQLKNLLGKNNIFKNVGAQLLYKFKKYLYK